MLSILKRTYAQNDGRIFTYHADKGAYAEIKSFEVYIAQIAEQEFYKPIQFFLHKLHGMAARIAGVIHTWNHTNPEDIPITIDEMALGIELAESYIPHAVFAYSPSGNSAYYDSQKILSWVRRHNHWCFKARDIAQGISNMTNANIFPALDLLEQHNYLRQIIIPEKSRICVMHPRFI